jgi:hypothetical protein
MERCHQNGKMGFILAHHNPTTSKQANNNPPTYLLQMRRERHMGPFSTLTGSLMLMFLVLFIAAGQIVAIVTKIIFLSLAVGGTYTDVP